ncbi:hypothetical protein OH76DRAFT_602820 [Lentinus brumalis]|uniref:Uncharacterized protein n=1 Tax=Lentinus brumalis TaxID=2498619 RepID=A0A371DUJ7_9APHY|nr:hypothetical protein OH76DRAFT_602820 [Polyporus brumalis]
MQRSGRIKCTICFRARLSRTVTYFVQHLSFLKVDARWSWALHRMLPCATSYLVMNSVRSRCLLAMCFKERSRDVRDITYKHRGIAGSRYRQTSY